MYKTIRMLPALLLLVGTACTNDLADNPAATGLPLVLEDVYIGTQTKAEPIETTAFEERDQLTATLTLGDVTSTGTYTYKNGKWETTTPAYWQNTTEEHTVTLRTPEPNPAMPDAFTADNWHQYDILAYTNDQVTPGTTSFQLAHTRAQLIVTLKAGKGLEDTDLSGATVKAGDSQLWHRTDQGAYYALIDPNELSPALTITCNGDTYTYDYHISLYANQCTLLALTLHKTGVSGISITSQPWEGVTATTTIDNTFTQIDCNGTSTITIPADATKLLITGTLTEANVTAINNAKDRITHLYITATAEDDDVWKVLKMGISNYANRTLQSVCLTQATCIGEEAFVNSTALEIVSLPQTASIGNDAFAACTALKTVSLPKATSIGNDAFNSCRTLKAISLPKATNIGEKAFMSCYAMESVSLPLATQIGTYAFYGCTELTTVSLPAATTIGSDAFFGCTKLTSISLPNATTINSMAFRECTNLTSINLPNARNFTGSQTFYGCTNLNTISLPKATNTGEEAFYGCTSLTTLFISTPDATEADAQAFADQIPTLTTIHYGYKGTGDYLDPANYTEVWTRE